MPEPVDADIAWIAEGEFCEPETVIALPDKTLLVSNVCDFREPGTGFLSLLDQDGKALSWRVLENLDAPLGIAHVESQLYLVDNNRLKVFAWPGYELQRTINLDSGFANDVAVDGDGTAYVTDTARGQVIVVAPDGQHSILIGEGIFPDANGIHISGRQLLVGGKHLWSVDLSSDSVSQMGPDWIGDIDGIEVEAGGTLQLTPVGGPLVRLFADGSIVVIGGEHISSANHGFAADLGLALIPTGFDNSVIAIRLATDASQRPD